MRNRIGLLCAAMAMAGSAVVLAGESFTATASMKTDAASATAAVKISIDRYATEKERTAVMAALKSGGTAGLREAVAKMKDAGTIEVGQRKTAIKYAYSRPTGDGRLVTVITAEPIAFLGAGLPEAKPKAGHDVAAALLVLDGSGAGHGELAPAATIKTNESGAVVVDDYGDAKVWLKDVAKAK
jgi:hypothetical protein